MRLLSSESAMVIGQLQLGVDESLNFMFLGTTSSKISEFTTEVLYTVYTLLLHLRLIFKKNLNV